MVLAMVRAVAAVVALRVVVSQGSTPMASGDPIIQGAKGLTEVALKVNSEGHLNTPQDADLLLEHAALYAHIRQEVETARA